MSWTKFRKSPHGCPYCSGKNKTTEDFAAFVKDSVEMLSEYRGLYYKIKCRCRECGYLWETDASNLKSGRGCPECGRRIIGDQKRKSEDQFIIDLAMVNPAIKLVGEYKTCKTFTQFRCETHNCVWESIPSNILNQSATCPECAAENFREKRLWSHDYFLEKLSEIAPSLVPLDQYVDSHTKIRFRCSIHDTEIFSDPSHILNDKCGCVDCRDGYTAGEKIIADYLKNLNIPFITQAKFDGCVSVNVLRFDFYVPSVNLAIEYDGEQHYYPLFPVSGTDEEKMQNFQDCVARDKIKNEYCKRNNISLLRIPYWDFSNINKILEKEFIHTQGSSETVIPIMAT